MQTVRHIASLALVTVLAGGIAWWQHSAEQASSTPDASCSSSQILVASDELCAAPSGNKFVAAIKLVTQEKLLALFVNTASINEAVPEVRVAFFVNTADEAVG